MINIYVLLFDPAARLLLHNRVVDKQLSLLCAPWSVQLQL